MFIIILTYKVELATIDEYLNDHIDYLKEQYELGNFIASGRKVPRTGGVIISKITDKNILNKVIDKDPFKLNNIAKYEIIEFVPSMTSENLAFLMP